jgi:hypothetical protein
MHKWRRRNNHKTFADKFAQYLRRPDAELHSFRGIDPISNRNDGIKVIKHRIIFFSIIGSYPNFSDN